VELKRRTEREKKLVALEAVVEEIQAEIAALQAEVKAKVVRMAYKE